MTAVTCESPEASTAPTGSREPVRRVNLSAGAAAPIICPVCGGENAPDAVFCGNPACHKALGDFKYVLEVLREESRWQERLAEKVTAFIGKPQFLAVHALWLALWVAINTGVFAFIRTFDEYPFGLLSLILAAEAIFITSWILISNNRQNAHADKRAELDYEVSVRNHRQISTIDTRLNEILQRLERLEKSVLYGDQRQGPDR